MRSAALALVLSGAAAFGGELLIGSQAPEFALRTLDGAQVSAKSLQGTKATVIGFVAARCPVSNAYNQRMLALHRDFATRGVAFVLVDSNSNETAAELQTYVKQARFVFPLYQDPFNRVADLLGAQTTPEMFLFDSKGVLRYHGAIDDAQTEARVKVHALRVALEAVLAGKPVEAERTRAFGCTLHRVRT